MPRVKVVGFSSNPANPTDESDLQIGTSTCTVSGTVLTNIAHEDVHTVAAALRQAVTQDLSDLIGESVIPVYRADGTKLFDVVATISPPVAPATVPTVSAVGLGSFSMPPGKALDLADAIDAHVP